MCSEKSSDVLLAFHSYMFTSDSPADLRDWTCFGLVSGLGLQCCGEFLREPTDISHWHPLASNIQRIHSRHSCFSTKTFYPSQPHKKDHYLKWTITLYLEQVILDVIIWSHCSYMQYIFQNNLVFKMVFLSSDFCAKCINISLTEIIHLLYDSNFEQINDVCVLSGEQNGQLNICM